jgi:hypothetical protein
VTLLSLEIHPSDPRAQAACKSVADYQQRLGSPEARYYKTSKKSCNHQQLPSLSRVKSQINQKRPAGNGRASKNANALHGLISREITAFAGP